MIPTETPSSAAASAALWPASPAPITRTSWDGTGADAIPQKAEGVVGIRHFVIGHVGGGGGGPPPRPPLVMVRVGVPGGAPPRPLLQPALFEATYRLLAEISCSL